MCSEENLLRFQDLTWLNFVMACHNTRNSVRNPWAANGPVAEADHNQVVAVDEKEAERLSKQDKQCHPTCHKALKDARWFSWRARVCVLCVCVCRGKAGVLRLSWATCLFTLAGACG